MIAEAGTQTRACFCNQAVFDDLVAKSHRNPASQIHTVLSAAFLLWVTVWVKQIAVQIRSTIYRQKYRKSPGTVRFPDKSAMLAPNGT